MSEYTIYHNPSCSKSRQALTLLKEKGIEPKVIEYLQEKLSVKEVETFINNSSESPESFLRKQEKEFSSINETDFSSAKKVAFLIHKYPKLLERPVVCCGDKTVIARPKEKLLELFS